LGRERGNNQIIRIIATLQKNANERLVIGNVGLGDGGVHETQIANGGGHGYGTHRSACRAADEIATGNDRNVLFVHEFIFG
jgi:hypothetical protein